MAGAGTCSGMGGGGGVPELQGYRTAPHRSRRRYPARGGANLSSRWSLRADSWRVGLCPRVDQTATRGRTSSSRNPSAPSVWSRRLPWRANFGSRGLARWRDPPRAATPSGRFGRGAESLLKISLRSFGRSGSQRDSSTTPRTKGVWRWQRWRRISSDELMGVLGRMRDAADRLASSSATTTPSARRPPTRPCCSWN